MLMALLMALMLPMMVPMLLAMLAVPLVCRYDQLRADTSSAHSFTLLKNFFTYVDDLEYVGPSSPSSSFELSCFFF